MIKEKEGTKGQRDTGTQDIKCRLCGNVSLLTNLTFGERTLARCASCKVMQVEPFPSHEEILSFYDGENFAKEDGTRFIGIAEKISVWFRKQRAKHIDNLVQKENARILDVGAGRGVMLNHLKNLGWETHGTITGDLRAAKFPPVYFDVVTLFHVLEHLESPIETLEEISRVIKPCGFLVLEAPNASGLLPRLFKTRWFGYNIPVHLFHFTPESLKKVLRDSGFSAQKEHYFSPEQSPFVFFQTLLNFLFRDNGTLFETLRRKENALAVSFKKRFFYAVCAVFLFPFSLIFSWLFGISKRGDIMRLYCKKMVRVKQD